MGQRRGVRGLARQLARASGRNKLKVWIKPPGWRPADVADDFSQARLQHGADADLHPPMSRAVQWFALVQFAVLLTGGAFFMAGDTAPLAHNAIWFAVLLVGQWALGAVMQGRIGMLMALMLRKRCAGHRHQRAGVFTEWHWLFKPLTMILLLFGSCQRLLNKRQRPVDSKPGFCWLPALAGSLAGMCSSCSRAFHPWSGEFSGGAPVLCRAVQTRAGVVSRTGALAATLGIGVACTPFVDGRPAPCPARAGGGLCCW